MSIDFTLLEREFLGLFNFWFSDYLSTNVAENFLKIPI